MKEILKDFGCSNLKDSPMMNRISDKEFNFGEANIRANSSLGLSVSNNQQLSREDFSNTQLKSSIKSANFNVMQDFIELKGCL